MIPPELVTMFHALCQTLSNTLKNGLSNDIFSEDVKIALVSPLNKDTCKENDI